MYYHYGYQTNFRTVYFQVYSMDQWTSAKERNFDEICENVVSGMDKLDNLWQFCREARTQKPVFHFIGTLLFFFSLAALGNRINNFFLAYSWPMHFSCCLACTRRESYSSTELLLSWRLMKSSREKTTWKNQNNGGRQNIVYKTLTFHLSFSILTKDCMRLSNIPPWSFSKRNNLLSLLTLG